MILALMDRPGGRARAVELAGAMLTLPAEARFAWVASVQQYVDRVLGAARRRRAVRSGAAATDGAGPAFGSGRALSLCPRGDRRPGDRRQPWAMRELVVLHEVAHHLDPTVAADTPGPVHGPDFVHTLMGSSARCSARRPR